MSRVIVMPRRTLLAFAGMFVLVALAGLAEPGLALTMAPALLMLALFAGGVRPGEALIERLRTGRVTPVPARAVSTLVCAWRRSIADATPDSWLRCVRP